MEILIYMLIGCIIVYLATVILDKVFFNPEKEYKKIAKRYTDRCISYDKEGNMIYNSELSKQSFIIQNPKALANGTISDFDGNNDIHFDIDPIILTDNVNDL